MPKSGKAARCREPMPTCDKSHQNVAYASIRFPPTRFCDFHKVGQLLRAIGVRLLDRLEFNAYGRLLQLTQDR